MQIKSKKRWIHKSEPSALTPHGRMSIHKIGSVSWKNVDNGHQLLRFGLANNAGMVIELNEFYDGEHGKRTVARDTMIEINREEAQAIIEHLQGWLDRTAPIEGDAA